MNDSNKAANDRAATKYDAAVAKARGEEPAAVAVQPQKEPTHTELAIGEVPAGALVPAKEAMLLFQARVKAGTHEQAPQLATIPVGQTLLDWKLEGNGPVAEFTEIDQKTGVVEVQRVKTWVLSKDGVRISILSSTQLDTKLPAFVGEVVSITRGEDKKRTSGPGTYSDFLVIGETRADGTARDWSKKPTVPQVKA